MIQCTFCDSLTEQLIPHITNLACEFRGKGAAGVMIGFRKSQLPGSPPLHRSSCPVARFLNDFSEASLRRAAEKVNYFIARHIRIMCEFPS